MQKRTLGRTDLSIAPLVLGGNVFGWTADEAASFAVLDRFAEAGFNAIDTANNYSRWVPGNVGGESESIIGKWMEDRGNRRNMIVFTKVGSDVGQGRRDLSANHIETAIEDSLRRLRTDYVDLYISHWHVPDTPCETILREYERLVAKGKVRFIGASNHDAAQLGEALGVANRTGLPRYDALQTEYSLYNRSTFEGPLRDTCLGENIGVVVYYALAQGFLSGKYRTDADLAGSARGAGVRPYLNARGLRILDALDAVSSRHGANPAEVALSWTMTKPGIVAPIASATRVGQIDSLIRSVSIALSADDIDLLDCASGDDE